MHAQELLPVLRASSAAHPRLHTLWPTLLALLLPGYSIARVRRGNLTWLGPQKH